MEITQPELDLLYICALRIEETGYGSNDIDVSILKNVLKKHVNVEGVEQLVCLPKKDGKS